MYKNKDAKALPIQSRERKRNLKMWTWYCEVLKVFFTVTERFSGSLYVRCNTFWKQVMTIKTAIDTLENSDDYKLEKMAEHLNKKYDKYWSDFDTINIFLLYSNVLDPRYKFNYIRWSLNKYYDKAEVATKMLKVKNGMTKLFNWYEKRSIDLGKTQNVYESYRNMEKNA